MRKFKFATLFIIVALLSGCVAETGTITQGSAPRTESLNTTDPEGVLIVGFPRRITRSVHTLVIHTYDPDQNLLVSPAKGGQIFKLSSGGTFFHNVDVIDDVQYLLQKLPSGHYYLTGVYWGPHGRTLMANGSVAAEVKPGTVSYVGNLEFDTPIFVFSDVDIELNGRNDDAARDLVAQYQQIKPEMQNASLRIFKLSCLLEDGVEACYAP